VAALIRSESATFGARVGSFAAVVVISIRSESALEQPIIRLDADVDDEK
jgi:hypothetical protein